MKQCAICGGNVSPGKTTVTVDTGDAVVVVRDVPVLVCSQCGKDWLEDRYTIKVEEIVERACRDKAQIEIVALAT